MAAHDQKGRLPRFPAGKTLIWQTDDWNAFVDLLEPRLPLAGDNVIIQTTPSGALVSAIAAVLELPFTVSMSTDDESNTQLAISSGRYRVGAAGDWTDVEALDATTGSYAYFVIEQDAGRAVTSVALEVEETEQDAVTVTGDPATSFTSRVLLGIEDGGILKQHVTGNFSLSLWQIDGEVVRWADTTGGEGEV